MDEKFKMKEISFEDKKAPKSRLLSCILNCLIASLTAVALILLSKLCLPDVYKNIKAAFSSSYPATVKVSEVFENAVSEFKSSEVFSFFSPDEPKEEKVLIKENSIIQNVSRENSDCRPVNGGVIRRFGAYTDEDGNRANNPGVDIGVPLGSSVAAFRSGKVITVSENENLGKYIIIDHGDGICSLYSYLLCTLVPEEAEVKVGQRIALSGRYNECAMLHFEITLDGTHLDPLQYIDVW